MATLYELTKIEQQLYEELVTPLSDFATEDELVEKHEIIRDTMEAIGAEDKLESYAKIIRQLEADEEAFKKEAERLSKRAKTAHNSVERLKDGILMYMEAGHIDKTDAGLFKLSIRTTQVVDVTDIDKVPEEFKKVKTEVSVDKLKVRNALKNGAESIEGIEMVDNKSIRIS